MKIALTIGSILVISGCSGMQYAIDNYKGVEVVRHNYQGQTFRIFDKPEENRLMITPTIGQSAARGATFGAASTPEIYFQNAGQTFLTEAGRNCEVGDPKIVAPPQYEIFYTCA